jgi:hypothetical protein
VLKDPGIIGELLGDVNDILGIRDELGVGLKQVAIVTRTWSGVEIGDGTYTETRVPMLPTPHVVIFSQDLRIGEGGAVKRQDAQLKMISKANYDEDELDFSDVSGPVEKFYELSGLLYRPIQVIERHVTWSVTLRRSNDQTRNNG